MYGFNVALGQQSADLSWDRLHVWYYGHTSWFTLWNHVLFSWVKGMLYFHCNWNWLHHSNPKIQVQRLWANGLKMDLSTIPTGQGLYRKGHRLCIPITKSGHPPHHSLMMEAEVSESLDYSSILTQLVIWKDFIEFSLRKSFKSYMY
jgi:hypothetical protein